MVQYDKLFHDILHSKVQKFELNPVKKMRGFSIFSKECYVYMFNKEQCKMDCYIVHHAYFHYDCNQWSTDYYKLSKTIMALKSFKNFSFENLEPTTPNRRHRDLIDFFLEDKHCRTEWMFVASSKFDRVFVKSEFDNSEELANINARDIKIVNSNVYQTKTDGLSEQWGHRKDSILDVVYAKDKKMVGLVVEGTDIDDDVFEELSDMIRKYPDTITDITLNLKNQLQLEYFIKSIRNKKNLDQIVFKNDVYITKRCLSWLPFVHVAKIPPEL